MKRIFWSLIAALVISACGEKPAPEPTPQDSVSVSVQELSFTDTDSSTKLVYVTSGGAWTATASDAWIKASPLSGSGSGQLSVTVSQNTATGPRTGTISVKSGSASASVKVTQEGSAIMQIVPAPATFDGHKRSGTTYQLLVYSFADSDGDGVGDFKGIEKHLDYLDELGVTALWLSPAHPTNSYHGYDVNDYMSVNPLFGTEADFQSLIDAAHARGIQIYMDFVLNHTGLGHAWFQSVKADPDGSPYRDYYVLSSDYSADEQAGIIDNYGGAKSAGMGSWHALSGGDNGYKGRLHFVLDSNAKTITVTETDAATDTPPATSDWYIYCNSFKGMKKTAEAVYELTIDFDTDWGFLVCSKTDWSSGSKYGASAGAGALAFGKPFSLYTNANNDAVANIIFGGQSVYYFGAFGSYMPDVNYGPYTSCEESPAFKATVEAATKWIGMGVDGFRLDAVIWIYNAQITPNQRFLDQWYQAVNAAYKAAGHSDDIFVVGEAWDDHDKVEKNYYKGLISNFEFNYGGMVSGMLGNQNASGYVNAVNSYLSDHKAVRPDAITSLFLTNHDQDRFAEWVGKNEAKEKQAAALLLSTPGKPFVYQGEELGYYGKKGATDAPVRQPVAWDSSLSDLPKYALSDNHKSDLTDYNMVKAANSVASQSADENSVLNVYKTWSRLRNTYPALASGTMTNAGLSGSSIASWYMESGSEKLLVIHNVAASEKTTTVTDDMSKPIALLGSGSVKNTTLTLGPNSSVAFQLNR